MTHLLSNEILDVLSATKNSQELKDILTPTDYGKHFREQDKGVDSSFEDIYGKVLVERYNFLSKVSTDDIREFLISFQRKFEIQNIMRILRSMIIKTTNQPFDGILYPTTDFSNINYDAICEAENLEDAIAALRNTPYRRVKDNIDWYNKYDSLLPIEFGLRKIYYNMLFENLKRIPSGDRKNVDQLIRTEVDIANCFTSCAANVFDYDEELIESLLIPYPSKISMHTLRSVIRIDSEHEILTLLSPYYEVIKNLLAKEEAMAQTKALRLLRNEVIKQKTLESMNFTYVLCYLYLCEFEFRDLTFITMAVQHNVKSDDYLIYKKMAN
jgi:vacuolar-type H+-ATPase subunit C/Vma6